MSPSLQVIDSLLAACTQSLRRGANYLLDQQHPDQQPDQGSDLIADKSADAEADDRPERRGRRPSQEQLQVVSAAKLLVTSAKGTPMRAMCCFRTLWSIASKASKSISPPERGMCSRSL